VYLLEFPSHDPDEMETLAQTRGREIARGNIARDLATSPDFDTSQLLNYI